MAYEAGKLWSCLHHSLKVEQGNISLMLSSSGYYIKQRHKKNKQTKEKQKSKPDGKPESTISALLVMLRQNRSTFRMKYTEYS